jgi:hypothetical protein
MMKIKNIISSIYRISLNMINSTVLAYGTHEDMGYLRKLLKEDLERLKEVDSMIKAIEEYYRHMDDMLEFLRT